MAILPVTSILSLFLLANRVLALQVSPNSPCASVCLDDPSLDASDPNSSNTYGSDIVCLDTSFHTTTVGQKYESCVSCLQNSTASASGESDTEWFLYNLRYSVGSCLFDFSNATDAVSTPCATDDSCGPLRNAIEDGNFIATNETEYSYCTADDNAILGSYLSKCITCLQDSGSETYLANFLIALQAGCLQQPPAGTIIGLEGTVFSTTPVNITSPGVQSNAVSSQSGHKGLKQGAIIGIAVGLGVLLILTIAILFVWYRKRRNLDRMKRLRSPLDARFGAPNITSPSSGAYGNPYTGGLVKETTFDLSRFKSKDLKEMGQKAGILRSRSAERKGDSEWLDAHAHLAAQPPVYTESTIPTHQAYIATSPSERHTSGSTSNYSFHLPGYASSKKSSNPSTHTTPRTTPYTSPNYVPPGPSPQPPRPSPQPPRPSPQPPRAPSRNSPQQTGPSPQPPRAPSRNSPYQPGPSPPLRTFTPSQQPPPINTHPSALSRTLSKNRGFPGQAMASAVESATSMDVPVSISGPMIKHGGRFDFELAERERLEKQGRDQQESRLGRHEGPVDERSPESAVSQEQWPGSY